MKRIVPGILLAAFWLILLLKGSILSFNAVVCIMIFIGCGEYLRMAAGPDLGILSKWFLAGVLFLPVLGVSLLPGDGTLAATIFCSFFLLTFFIISRYRFLNDSYQLYARLIFGLIYIGFLGAHFVLLRQLDQGAAWLIIVTSITACSDSGAYFIGGAVGKHRMSPYISPNKTVEGAVGGLCLAVCGALFFSWLLFPEKNYLFIAAAAVVVGFVGIGGDLAESIIKRGTNTKDSGTLLAGHGGILDRIDSLLFAVPAMYYFLVLTGA
ncbi:phosphatidate cytidylyltransferase [Desulfomarina sp.]